VNAQAPFAVAGRIGEDEVRLEASVQDLALPPLDGCLARLIGHRIRAGHATVAAAARRHGDVVAVPVHAVLHGLAVDRTGQERDPLGKALGEPLIDAVRRAGARGRIEVAVPLEAVWDDGALVPRLAARAAP
jgi:hypothetical protein